MRKYFTAMGGDNEIVLVAPDDTLATLATEAAISEVLRIEGKYSRYRKDSELSQINSAAGKPSAIFCDEETVWLLNFADTLYRQSDGLFDITSGILRGAWDFSHAAVPSVDTLAPLLKLVGWEKIERHSNSIRLPLVGMEIDFGGFGKEYASDRAASVLSKMGITHGYVNLGGDICVIGPQPDGKPWLIGIQNPRRQGSVVATIPISRGALATSGDYEKYFSLNGKRYCHVLNPKTGYPVDYWSSVSVLAPLTIVAGSYSTITMLKESAGLQFLEEAQVPYLGVDVQAQVFTNAFHPPE